MIQRRIPSFRAAATMAFANPFCATFRDWVRSFSQTLAPLQHVIAVLDDELVTADDRFASIAAEDPVVARLTTVPGIGKYSHRHSRRDGRCPTHRFPSAPLAPEQPRRELAPTLPEGEQPLDLTRVTCSVTVERYNTDIDTWALQRRLESC